MKIKNGKIIEATEAELFNYYLTSGYAEFMNFYDYRDRCVALGTKIIEAEKGRWDVCVNFAK